MKELSIKEKARRYDEALKVLHKYDGANIMFTQDLKEEMFPELRESEDEKIRKEIINIISSFEVAHLRTAGLPTRIPKYLAWLEKQVSQDNAEDVDILHRFSFYSYKDEPNILYLSGFYVNEEYRNKGIGTKILEVADEVAKSLGCNAIRLKTKKDSEAERLYRTHGYNSLATEDKDKIWLEKQGEQKLNPVLDIEIPFGANDSELQEASYHIPEGFHAEIDGNRVVIKRGEQKPTDNEMIEILRAEYEKGRADAIEEMHNHTWSEEDELHIKELESLVKQEWAKAERENDRDKIHKMSDLSFFLKTLKPQPKQEWSEEDEKHVNDLIAYFTADMSLKHTEEDTANWLKSLRPQPQWKPSEEQMNTLEYYMHTLVCNEHKEILFGLYSDLKKLKG